MCDGVALSDPPEPQSASTTHCVVHLIRSDATNSAVWQRCELHVCEARSVALSIPPTFDGDVFELLDQAACNKRLGDMQVVADGSGMGTFAMVCKQLGSIGAPSWSEIHAHCEGQAEDVRPLAFFCLCTDAGSDQVKARKIMSEQVGGF